MSQPAAWLEHCVVACAADNGWDAKDVESVVNKLWTVGIRQPSALASASLLELNLKLLACRFKPVSQNSLQRLQHQIAGGCSEAPTPFSNTSGASSSGAPWASADSLVALVRAVQHECGWDDEDANRVVQKLQAAGIRSPADLSGTRLDQLNQRLRAQGSPTLSRESFDRLQQRVPGRGARPVATPQIQRQRSAARAVATFPAGRTFGIELENCTMPAQQLVVALSRAVPGTPFRIHEYGFTGYDRTTWVVKPDGSVPNGGELVSPILQGEQGLVIAQRVIRALADVGAKVDKTCGLHVHVGIGDFWGHGHRVCALVLLHESAAPVLDSLVAPSRRSSRYCGATHEIAVRLARQGNLSLERVRDSPELSALRGDRYVALNMWHPNNLGRRTGTTAEFRKHGGTKNASKVLAWATLCVQIVETAARRPESLTWDSLAGLRNAGSGRQGLERLLELVGMASSTDATLQQAAEYLLARQEELRSAGPRRSR